MQLKKEYESSISQLREGIMITPSAKSSLLWQGFLFPDAGPFKGRILPFYVMFEGFPNSVPQIIFPTYVFHPYVDMGSGRYDTSEMYTKWNTNCRVYTLINYVYDSFIEISVPTNGTIFNPDAARLLKQSQSLFQRKAVESLPQSIQLKDFRDINYPDKWTIQKERLLSFIN